MWWAMTSEEASGPDRPTQAERRDRTRNALFKAAANEFLRYGYADSSMERVANEVWSSVEAGSTAGDASAGAASSRPDLYPLFASKEELALAVVRFLEETWYDEVGYLFADEDDPVGALLAVARGHAVFCRNDVPPALATLRAEFEGRDHPVGRAVNRVFRRAIDDTIQLIITGRRSGAIPPGPPPRALALAYLGALDWVVKTLRGQAPYDALLAEKAAMGLLGLAPAAG